MAKIQSWEVSDIFGRKWHHWSLNRNVIRVRNIFVKLAETESLFHHDKSSRQYCTS